MNKFNFFFAYDAYGKRHFSRPFKYILIFIMVMGLVVATITFLTPTPQPPSGEIPDAFLPSQLAHWL